MHPISRYSSCFIEHNVFLPSHKEFSSFWSLLFHFHFLSFHFHRLFLFTSWFCFLYSILKRSPHISIHAFGAPGLIYAPVRCVHQGPFKLFGCCPSNPFCLDVLLFFWIRRTSKILCGVSILCLKFSFLVADLNILKI